MIKYLIGETTEGINLASINSVWVSESGKRVQVQHEGQQLSHTQVLSSRLPQTLRRVLDAWWSNLGPVTWD